MAFSSVPWRYHLINFWLLLLFLRTLLLLYCWSNSYLVAGNLLYLIPFQILSSPLQYYNFTAMCLGCTTLFFILLETPDYWLWDIISLILENYQQLPHWICLFPSFLSCFLKILLDNKLNFLTIASFFIFHTFHPQCVMLLSI